MRVVRKWQSYICSKMRFLLSVVRKWQIYIKLYSKKGFRKVRITPWAMPDVNHKFPSLDNSIQHDINARIIWHLRTIHYRSYTGSNIVSDIWEPWITWGSCTTLVPVTSLINKNRALYEPTLAYRDLFPCITLCIRSIYITTVIESFIILFLINLVRMVILF